MHAVIAQAKVNVINAMKVIPSKQVAIALLNAQKLVNIITTQLNNVKNVKMDVIIVRIVNCVMVVRVVML